MRKSIMVQGTMSNAGKSLVAAALCRIFKQDGLHVAPFKSQNMALNSFVTRDGLEMGRAQVMQAEAAGAEPSVLMNPILLKPTSDQGSQVILNGEILGNMKARDYFAYKKELIPDILRAYDCLQEKYDGVVIEGAGSPAEINLKENDIVNMGLAKLVDAPVLLVGDIDRGGVFAQLYGTVELLEPEERARIKGLIINKFRGDPSLLDSGIQMLEEKCGIPVVGVLPYMKIDIEDEDSLGNSLETRTGRETSSATAGGSPACCCTACASTTEKAAAGAADSLADVARGAAPVDLAVIRLPHLSNYTDFQVFHPMRGVSLRYVTSVGELGDPDMIVLPGTKSTMADLRVLRESGLEAAILRKAEEGCVIFGICGGFQMLGQQLADPFGVEFAAEMPSADVDSPIANHEMRGLGLLPIRTVFSQEKTRSQVSGKIEALPGALAALGGMEIHGYEIHMGMQQAAGQAPEQEPAPAFSVICRRGESSVCDGAALGNVYGTYVHGIFDHDGVAQKLVEILAERAGKKLPDEDEPLTFESYKQKQYDLLAETFRKHLDMEKIYRIWNGAEK